MSEPNSTSPADALEEPTLYNPTVQSAFVVLGFLSEYRGRDIVKDGDRIEYFYQNEKAAADSFERYLHKLKEELRLSGPIQRKKDDGRIAFYSREITALLDSFYGVDFRYERTITYPDGRTLRYDICEFSYAAFKPITSAWFKPDEFDPRFSFLLGAYNRFAKKATFRFSNATHKAEIVAKLLREVNCDTVIWTSRQNCVPIQHEIEFVPTEELKSLFALPIA